MDVLKSSGLDPVADRLTYLHQEIAGSPDETPLNLESLKKMSLFIMRWEELPTPQISVSPDGLAHMEWHIAERGVLIMVFSPSDMVKIVAISQPPEAEEPQWNVRGVLPSEHVMDTVGLFVEMLKAG